MSSMWQRSKSWAYRHRGKLALTAAATAAAAAAYTYGRGLIEHRLEEWQSRTTTTAANRRHRRRQFRKSQAICDQAVRAAVPSILARLRQLLDCEALKEELQEPGLDKKAKFQGFEELKNLAWTRCVAAHYAIALLVMLLKIQGNVQAARLAASSQARDDGVSEAEVGKERADSPGLSAESREEFVALVQRFCGDGLEQLVKDLAPLVAETVGKIPLTENIAAHDLGSLARAARLIMEEDKTQSLHQRLTSWLFPDNASLDDEPGTGASLADTARDIVETDYFLVTARSCLTFVEESAASALAIALFPPEAPVAGMAMATAIPVVAISPLDEVRMTGIAEAMAASPSLNAFCETIFESLDERQ